MPHAMQFQRIKRSHGRGFVKPNQFVELVGQSRFKVVAGSSFSG